MTVPNCGVSGEITSAKKPAVGGSVRVACGGSHHAAGEAVTEHASKQQDEFAQAVLSGGTATLRNGLSAGSQFNDRRTQLSPVESQARSFIYGSKFRARDLV